MKKTAKDILLYAKYKDFANKAGDIGNTIYLNIPKNNDYIEVMDAVSELMATGNRGDILFIATTQRAYMQVLQAGYDAVMLTDIMTPDTYVTDRNRNTYVRILRPSKYDKYSKLPHKLHIIVQSIDNMPDETISQLGQFIQPHTIMYLCYDAMIPKQHMGLKVATSIWRHSGYEVQKIGRDRYSTSMTLYSLKNKLRERKFDMPAFLTELTSKEPYLNVFRVSEIDIDRMNYDMNVPIITPYRSMVIELTEQIRKRFGFTEVNEFYPKPGEWLVLEECTFCSTYSGSEEVFDKGYRFKVKTVTPMFGEDNRLMYFHITFDHMKPDRSVMEYSINISPEGLNYRLSPTPYDGIIKGVMGEPCKASFGYVLRCIDVSDQVYDNSIVIFKNTTNSIDDRIYLYTSVVGTMNTCSIYLIMDK